MDFSFHSYTTTPLGTDNLTPAEVLKFRDEAFIKYHTNSNFLNKIEKSITLEEIKKNKQLSHLSLIKQSRLSVMPIDSKSWKILNNMGKV